MPGRACVRLVCLVAVAAAAPAHADVVQLRVASAAPAGTGWARELAAFGREVERSTSGAVKVKLYFGGVAGDDLAAFARLQRGQLDAVAGTVLCDRVAPSLRVLRVLGLVQTRAEGEYVLNRLRSAVDQELAHGGVMALGLTIFGGDIVFARKPIATLEALRHTRLWIWSIDDVLRAEAPLLGLTTQPMPVEAALDAYERGDIDGFLGLPTAALNYQWSARTRWFIALPVAMRSGCLVVSQATFDGLTPEVQEALRRAGATLGRRFSDATRAADEQLMSGLFQRQGLKPATPSPTFLAAFRQAARDARVQLPDDVVPRALVTKVNGWLADYRVERP